MQLQFEKRGIQCLQTVKREIQSQEQTQEIRIGDGMPEIGSVIGAWGQVILRGKEWQADGMRIHGGTMVWVQYLPEGGGAPQCVESWLPFQMNWALPQSQSDGTILTQCCLCGVDARNTSARKIMLRTNVAVLAWAMERREQEVSSLAELPEDVELQQVTYPVHLPTEAGEKAFTLEETLNLPPSAPPMEKLVSYSLQPEITEEKLIGDKIVFRGNACLHLLYLSDDALPCAWDFELPFTQYGELEAEYGEDGQTMLLPCVTALEMEADGGQLHVKAGIVCQYRISCRSTVQVIQDAYSPCREVTPVFQNLLLPGILESRIQTVHVQQSAQIAGLRLVDVEFQPLSLHARYNAEGGHVELSGQFLLLYYDVEGIPHTAVQKWEQSIPFLAGEETATEVLVFPQGKAQGTMLSGSAQLSADIRLVIQTVSAGAIPMATGLEAGEAREPVSDRPSLLLRRCDGLTLWELAKKTGSTVAAIQEANQLQAEPEQGRMLLIPLI